MLAQARIVVTVIALIASMVATGWLGRRHRLGALSLGLISFSWLTVDNRFEGAILVTVTPTHGLTTTDLIGLVGIVIAVVELWRLRPGRMARRPRGLAVPPTPLGEAPERTPPAGSDS